MQLSSPEIESTGFVMELFCSSAVWLFPKIAILFIAIMALATPRNFLLA